jgi:hypothetical protein
VDGAHFLKTSANIKVTGEAEAAAIEARGKALGNNPNLVIPNAG